MPPQTAKEPPKRKGPRSIQKQGPVPRQPVSPCDDLQARIAQRAYELNAERGYQEGHALDDWLEAEREILGFECNA